jgi:Spy/CpxP family protein refolding chaperone
MKRNLTWATALILGSSLLFVGLAQAKGNKHSKRGPGGMLTPRNIDRVASKLQLDEATVTQLKDRVYAAEKEGIGLKAQLEEARLELRRALDSAEPNRDVVMAKIDEVGRLHTAVRKHKTGLMLDLRAMLTPGQRAELKELMQKRRKRWKKGNRRGGKRNRDGGRPASMDK